MNSPLGFALLALLAFGLVCLIAWVESHPDTERMG